MLFVTWSSSELDIFDSLCILIWTRQCRHEDSETSFTFFTTITKSKSNVDFEGETGVAGEKNAPGAGL